MLVLGFLPGTKLHFWHPRKCVWMRVLLHTCAELQLSIFIHLASVSTLSLSQAAIQACSTHRWAHLILSTPAAGEELYLYSWPHPEDTRTPHDRLWHHHTSHTYPSQCVCTPLNQRKTMSNLVAFRVKVMWGLVTSGKSFQVILVSFCVLVVLRL